MPGQTSTKCIHRIISRILTALYFSRLLVFSHKRFGLRREPLMLLDYYKKFCLYQSFYFLREIKLAGTSDRTTLQRIGRPDVTRQMPLVARFSTFRRLA